MADRDVNIHIHILVVVVVVVVVVDEAPCSRDLTGQYLESQDLRASLAGDGRSVRTARNAAPSDQVKLITPDLMVPGDDGHSRTKS